MGRRVLEITLEYAKDLNKVTLISKMGVYVVVSISGGGKNQKTKTAADHGGDANPMWRFDMNFTVEEAALLQDRLTLDFKLKCERALKDKVVGEAHVPVKDLLDFPANGGAGEKRFVTYQVKKPNGRPKGHLTFSYRFRVKTATVMPPPPPPPPAAAAAAETGGMPLISYPAVEPCFLFPAPAPASYPAVEPSFLFPAPAPASYPPVSAGGSTPLEWSLPPWCGYPPPPPPPVMQLGPNWWIADWRYDFRCS